jgi:hypothetical protein
MQRAPVRRLARRRAASVEDLEAAIRVAVLNRQWLRERRADEYEVEANRLELVGLQWELSYALIERHASDLAKRRAARRRALLLEPANAA